jgi:hypothetical protein
MTLERIDPDGLARPETYTHVVVAAGSRLVFVAGQVAEDENGNVVGATLLQLVLGESLAITTASLNQRTFDGAPRVPLRDERGRLVAGCWRMIESRPLRPPRDRGPDARSRAEENCATRPISERQLQRVQAGLEDPAHEVDRLRLGDA